MLHRIPNADIWGWLVDCGGDRSAVSGYSSGQSHPCADVRAAQNHALGYLGAENELQSSIQVDDSTVHRQPAAPGKQCDRLETIWMNHQSISPVLAKSTAYIHENAANTLSVYDL